VASEVNVLNRARHSIFVEVGRIQPYETARVSRSWYLPRRGQEKCVSVPEYREQLLHWGVPRLQAECSRAGLDKEGEAPKLRRRLYDHIGLDYDDSELIDGEPDTDGGDADEGEPGEAPTPGEALEMAYSDKVAFVADRRDEPLPNDWGNDELDAWLIDQAGS